MPKIEDIRLAKSALTDHVYVGVPAKGKDIWTGPKKDVTNDFIHAVIQVYGGFVSEVQEGPDGKKWQITVKDITDSPPEGMLSDK